MQELGIDIETYSSNDLPSCGVYKYVEAEDFTILLFAYSVDGGPVTCCDFAQGEELPEEILAALRDPQVQTYLNPVDSSYYRKALCEKTLMNQFGASSLISLDLYSAGVRQTL